MNQKFSALFLVQQLQLEPMARWAEHRVPKCDYEDNCLTVTLCNWENLTVQIIRQEDRLHLLYPSEYTDIKLCTEPNLEFGKNSVFFNCKVDKEEFVLVDEPADAKATALFLIGFRYNPVYVEYPSQFQAHVQSVLKRAFTKHFTALK